MTLGLRGSVSPTRAAEEEVPFAATQPVSRVVLIRHPLAVDADHRIHAEIVAEMLDTAVQTLAGEKEALSAWQRYFHPEDTVGVKFSRCSWMQLPTEQATIDAIVARLRSVGIPEERIYPRDYGMPLDQCTALVNVPPIKVHTLTGIAVSIKNYINFNEEPLDRFHFEGSVKLGETWLKPEVKGKTRLIVVDALRPYFGLGPQINPLHRWDYKGLLVGTDPVAIDTVCLSLCQAKRNLFKGEEWPITPPPTSIAAADTEYHLGTSDPRKIQLIRLGWQEEVLV
jgi:hypothetical protein